MKRKYLLLLFCLQISHTIFAQFISSVAGTRYFRTFSIEQGLSKSTVFALQQDELGFIWVGTRDGLNRYDGKSFRLYRPLSNDKSSLFSRHIRSLFIDRKQRLWVGGDKGVSCYDYKKEAFINYALPVKSGEWFVSGISADNSNTIWVASNTGEIYYLDHSTDRFEHFDYKSNGPALNRITQLVFAGGCLFMATNRGVGKLDIVSKEMTTMGSGRLAMEVNCFYIHKNEMWIGAVRNGLFRLNLTNDSLINYRHRSDAANGIIDDEVRSIGRDESGNLWVGTLKGLSILDKDQKRFSNYEHQFESQYSLSQNSVRCIFRDRQNGMWLGTYFGGLSYYHKDDIRFNLLNQSTNKIALNDQVVNVISEDPEHNIWIGTNDKGINIWNRKTNSMSYYSHKESDINSISANNIKAIVFDGDYALIGTHNGGLNVWNTKTGNVKRYVRDGYGPNSLSTNMVYTLLKDKKQRIWVGTRKGLFQFDLKKGTFKRYLHDTIGQRLSSEIITCLKEDSNGRLWIGTDNGITIFAPDNGRFLVFPGDRLSDKEITCISEDGNGRIWVGTKRGLNLFDKKQNKFILYRGTDELMNGTIYGMQPDNDHHIWIMTAQGLVKLNDRLSGKPLVFTNQAGLENNRFDPPAFCKASDGMLFFGGLNGIVYFDPRIVKTEPLQLNLVFTGLEVFNYKVLPGGDDGILKAHINETALLRFGPEQRQFTLFFSAFNYISPGSIRYQYMLKDFDHDWQVCENIPKATYTNLKPGSYTLQIQAIGPLGEKSPIRSIAVDVLPPWWRSGWFFCFLTFTAIAIGYVAYRVIRERIQSGIALRKERNERERLEYLNQMKMDFFTNVSHEFKTPLTLIVAPLEELIENQLSEKRRQKYFELMLDNAKHLYRLVDELMEFRKTEEGVKTLKLMQGNIVPFLQDIYSSFLELSRKKNITYNFKTTADILLCSFDKDVIEKICNNLLSNAFKNTHSGDTIALSISATSELILKVSDTGIGIAPVDQERLFERFYQVSGKDATPGWGVGLAYTKSLVALHKGTIMIDSEPGNGSTFTVVLPLKQQGYPEDAFVEDPSAAWNLGSKTVIENQEAEVEIEEPNEGLPQHLLIVDDNEQIVDYLSDHFEHQFKVSKAYNGSQAIEIVEKQIVDFVISDVMMVGMDGVQLCKRIKQNIHTCHIPVVLLTAKAGGPSQIKGLDAGADDYIAKPFSISVLNAKVRNISRSRRRLKEYYSASTDIMPEEIALNKLDEKLLRRVIELVEANLSDPDFSVANLSREIGMSRSNLYLKLRAITGESIIDFIKRIRFKKATELLEDKEYSVTDVAYMSGFSSLSYFSTAFKQYYGYLPTEHGVNK